MSLYEWKNTPTPHFTGSGYIRAHDSQPSEIDTNCARSVPTSGDEVALYAVKIGTDPTSRI
jgi:hypothetical protein